MPDVKKTLHDLLDPIEQTHLLAHAHEWTEEELEALKAQIRHLDAGLFCRQQQLLRTKTAFTTSLPLLLEAPSVSPADCALGEELLRSGKCGCVVLAGGQGSRLRLEGPKGCMPISHVRHKSLFEMLIDKVHSASLQSGCSLPIAFMTSTANRMATETFFIRQRHFGLSPAQIAFFSQKVWPLLGLSGNLFLSSPGRLAMGPNGNGDFFAQFVENGIWQRWADQGIEYVRVMPIDNPLALPFDAGLLGFHHRLGNDVSIQSVCKRAAEEKVGSLVHAHDNVQIAEYGEIPPSKAGFANVGLYTFSMEFVRKMASITLPLHPTMKAVATYGENGIPAHPNAWKFEHYLFDAFPYAKQSRALIYSREECFAPLKNLVGEGNLEQVRKVLLAHERVLYERLTGQPVPPHTIFELASAFYYPTEQFKAYWKGRPFPGAGFIRETL